MTNEHFNLLKIAATHVGKDLFEIDFSFNCTEYRPLLTKVMTEMALKDEEFESLLAEVVEGISANRKKDVSVARVAKAVNKGRLS